MYVMSDLALMPGDSCPTQVHQEGQVNTTLAHLTKGEGKELPFHA